MLQTLLWQICDSAFPAGGFAHSAGLEATLQSGELRDLRHFSENYLRQLERSALPFVNAVYTEDFFAVDRACDVFTTVSVTNRASRTQGQAFLATCVRSFPSDPLRLLRENAELQRSPQHFAPVFGACLHTLGCEVADARMAFVYVSLRGLLSAAVRLGVVGPYQAQRLQFELSPLCQQVAEKAAMHGLRNAAMSWPLLDVLHGQHDRLYSRLFQS